MMNKRIIWIFLFGFIILLSACSGEKEETDDYDHGIYPLTGLETKEGANDRIVSVMVNNHLHARPQSGLSKADIVFEILVEGDITRFLALFQSEKPEVVGPVRSAREYYFELADRYGTLYIHHGAAKSIDKMIQARGIEHLDGGYYDNDKHLFKREDFRKSPHNSYLQSDAVYEEAEVKGYDITCDYKPLPFLEKSKKITGEPAQDVEITYGTNTQDKVTYHYNSEEEIYTRFNGQEQMIDLHSEKPIKTTNIFIVEADHEVIDEEGRRAIDLESGGNAYLLQKGKVKNIKWINQRGRIIPEQDGQDIGFIPGKTWVNIVPSDPGIHQSVNISKD